MRCPTHNRMAITKDWSSLVSGKQREDLKLLYTAERNVNCNNHSGKLAVPTNVEHMLWELTHDLTIPFPGIFLTGIWTCVRQNTDSGVLTATASSRPLNLNAHSQNKQKRCYFQVKGMLTRKWMNNLELMQRWGGRSFKPKAGQKELTASQKTLSNSIYMKSQILPN